MIDWGLVSIGIIVGVAAVFVLLAASRDECPGSPDRTHDFRKFVTREYCAYCGASKPINKET
jgi:hypothetical protein